MKTRSTITTFALAAVVASTALPAAAFAANSGQSQIGGTITAFDGKSDVHVQTASGEISDITLHRGTIINPTGLKLRPGMNVTILGNAAGPTFAANEIDTAYHVSYALVPAYGYGPGYAQAGLSGGYGFGTPSFGEGSRRGGFGYAPVYVLNAPDDRSEPAQSATK